MQSLRVVLVAGLALQSLLGLADSSLPLPPYIKACSRNDPNLNECAKKNGNAAIPYIVKGDPKYKIPVLDPLVVTELRVEQGTKEVKIDLHATDMKITGLKAMHLDEYITDLEKGTIKVKATIPSMALDSKYTIDGAIHGLPIKGDGDLHITLVEYLPTIYYRMQYVERKGEKFMDLHPTSFHADVKNGTIRLSNLFNGDKNLGDNMNIFMNENWPTLYTELSPAIDEVVQQIMDKIMSVPMESVPFDNVYPEKV
ncbi:protein takeout-like [Bacillus rossius redtenbacheri]|uniref:protein takeout-like n=1 Tax=Bacillus rossius redtenbacheri TaxID=93214 RepID=UPI002FDEB65F